MTAPAPGLRERKRLATQRAIKMAALQLVDERGMHAITVDEIAARADVSPRTYFNYFATKELSLLGEKPSPPSERLTHWFADGGSGDLVADLRDLMVDVWRETDPDHELAALRQRVVKRHPEIAALRIATMREFEQDVAELVARRLSHDRPGTPPAELERLARMVTLVTIAVMRSAWQSWSGSEPLDLAPLLDHSFADLRDVFA